MRFKMFNVIFNQMLNIKKIICILLINYENMAHWSMFDDCLFFGSWI